jgi:signal transduction histidine kinase
MMVSSLTPFSYLTLIVGAFWSITMAVSGYGIPISLTIAALPVMGFVSLRMLAQDNPTQLSGAIFTILYIGVLGLLSVQMGGLVPGVTPWLAAAPLFVVTYNQKGGLRLTAATLAIGVVGVALWSALTQSGPYGLAPIKITLQAISTLGAASLLFIVARHQSRIREEALAHAHETNRTLAAALDEHKQTQAELEVANRRGLAAAHAAGMAEIATGVLHNIGNAINGVNVSASLATERLLPKRAADLKRLQEVLEHEVERGTEDSDRQRKVARFMAQALAKMQHNERALNDELQSLREGLDHVKVIVSTQQTHSRSRGLVHVVDLQEVIDQTLSLTDTSLTRTNIDVHVDVAMLPNITVDQYKLVQILTNVISNAADAIVQTKAVCGRIRIEGELRSRDIVIHIHDTGAGISPKALTRLFEHGFTTKQTGNGFGLHISALAAIELGGSLKAHSDGPGLGATFSLTLPLSGRSITPSHVLRR